MQGPISGQYDDQLNCKIVHQLYFIAYQSRCDKSECGGSSHQKTSKSDLWMSSVWQHYAIENHILRYGKVYYYSDAIFLIISFWSFVLNGQFENIFSS
jgi:hypothetical protein